MKTFEWKIIFVTPIECISSFFYFPFQCFDVKRIRKNKFHGGKSKKYVWKTSPSGRKFPFLIFSVLVHFSFQLHTFTILPFTNFTLKLKLFIFDHFKSLNLQKYFSRRNLFFHFLCGWRSGFRANALSLIKSIVWIMLWVHVVASVCKQYFNKFVDEDCCHRNSNVGKHMEATWRVQASVSVLKSISSSFKSFFVLILDTYKIYFFHSFSWKPEILELINSENFHVSFIFLNVKS